MYEGQYKVCTFMLVIHLYVHVRVKIGLCCFKFNASLGVFFCVCLSFVFVNLNLCPLICLILYPKYKRRIGNTDEALTSGDLETSLWVNMKVGIQINIYIYI